MDELVAVKEKEGAVARCERLRLLATAARHERDAAVDLDDLQEAENLEIEVEAAEQEADELQRLFNLEEQKYARVVEIPASGMGSKMREQPHGADEMFDISTEEAPEMKDIADEQPIEAENT
jgi:predicted RecB family nuclease